MIIEMYNDMF